MKHQPGQIVCHKTFGTGKVLSVSGNEVRVFFKDRPDIRNPIRVDVVPLEILPDGSDAWLDNLDPVVIKAGVVKGYLTHQEAVEKFLRIFPGGFDDPKYRDDLKAGERAYKLKACDEWERTLNRHEFEDLLRADNVRELVRRVRHVEGMLNLLSKYEKSALNDALKSDEDARRFVTGLFDLIYADHPFEQRFNRFTGVLDALPQEGSGVAKWPIQTLFPFLAFPKEHLFLKPKVTQEAARRRAFSLNYRSQPNWLTYSCLLRFGELLMRDLADLKPRDMIDIQSFIWVTGEDSYGGL